MPLTCGYAFRGWVRGRRRPPCVRALGAGGEVAHGRARTAASGGRASAPRSRPFWPLTCGVQDAFSLSPSSSPPVLARFPCCLALAKLGRGGYADPGTRAEQLCDVQACVLDLSAESGRNGSTQPAWFRAEGIAVRAGRPLGLAHCSSRLRDLATRTVCSALTPSRARRCGPAPVRSPHGAWGSAAGWVPRCVRAE